MIEPADSDLRLRLKTLARGVVAEARGIMVRLEVDFVALENLYHSLDKIPIGHAAVAIAIHQKRLTETMRDVQALWQDGLAILTAEIRIRGLL